MRGKPQQLAASPAIMQSINPQSAVVVRQASFDRQ
jgi:hypothetical protein